MSAKLQPAPAPGDALPVEARTRITSAAFRLFTEKGYSHTSVQDIADAASVKKSILYYYFGSKEGLYQTLFSESAGNLRGCLLQSLTAVGFSDAATAEGWRGALPAGISCGTLLAALAETLIALARDNREPVRFFMSHIFASDADRPPASTEEMENVMPHIIRHIADAGIKRGELSGEPKDLERLLLGALQYCIIRHLRSPKEEPLSPGLGKRMVDAALHGFAAPVAKNRTTAGRRGAATVTR